MSILVDVAALQAEVAPFGAAALLVTTATDGSGPHVASVIVAFERDHLVVGAGKRTRANVAEHPAVTLVWSGGADADYCLIVDAVARELRAETLVLAPSSAVLHRIASAPSDIPRCLPLDAEA